jgi:tetratricopeptide (TPR) repeat protein
MMFRKISFYGMLGHHQESIAIFKEALQHQKDEPQLYYNLGVAYALLKHRPEAIQAFQEAIRLKSDYAAARYDLGIEYVASGDLDSARQEYKILQKMDPARGSKLLSAMKK